ncbi:MAG: nitroreductase family deazaflavin-dependent oxidoreductase [Dehalococcoidia bacterium]
MTMPDDMRAYNRQVIEEFRANGGVLGGPFAGGDMLLLTTTGARSGDPHTAPMMFKEHGDRLLVIASNSGAPQHPDWYRNLAADRAVTVERGDERFEATARTTEGNERAALWADLIQSHPFFVQHQEGTSREIPLVLLERRVP